MKRLIFFILITTITSIIATGCSANHSEYKECAIQAVTAYMVNETWETTTDDEEEQKMKIRNDMTILMIYCEKYKNTDKKKESSKRLYLY